MRDRTKILLGVSAILGWGLLAVLLVTGSPRFPSFGPDSTDAGDIHRTHDDAAPILELRDLVNVNIRVNVVEQIEPHFFVLNAALVKLVETRTEYDSASTPALRAELLRKATTFHTTAHRHEEQIERVLTEDEKDRFHAYVREREINAGLPRDTAWHVH